MFTWLGIKLTEISQLSAVRRGAGGASMGNYPQQVSTLGQRACGGPGQRARLHTGGADDSMGTERAGG